jgi:hypothetical protein
MLRRPRRPATATVRLGVAALVPTLAACGAANGHRTPSVRPRDVAVAAPAAAPASCRATVDAELGAIARHIYAQATSGREVSAVRRRLGQSAALGAAVARGDAAATRAALRPLEKNQIRRIIITRGVHVLVDEGRTRALAPVRGLVRDAAGRPVGRYVVAVNSQAGIAGVTGSVTGARVAIGAHVQAPVTVAATAWPAGPLQIGLWPDATSASTCGPTADATRAAVVQQAGKRLFADESGGAATRHVLHHVALDPGFRRAVATRDPAALRAAIVRFFGDRTLHVVRIRATTPGGALINDVGGPYVLAPASRTVRDARGHTIGRVTLSIQDDAGYIKLLHRFIGVGVALRTAAGAVPGGVALHGTTTTPVHYTVGAFPTGPLDVTLSVPPA